jgi:hypothetical protein
VTGDEAAQDAELVAVGVGHHDPTLVGGRHLDLSPIDGDRDSEVSRLEPKSAKNRLEAP